MSGDKYLALLFLLHLQCCNGTEETCADGSTLNVVVSLKSEWDKSAIRQLEECLKLNFTLRIVDGQTAEISFKTCSIIVADGKILNLMKQFPDKVQSVRKQWTHGDDLLVPEIQQMVLGQHRLTPLPPANLVCEDYYGFGVEDVWDRGYSGKQVTVAILDVGINVELKDLKQNIDITKSYNFVRNNTDVEPESHDDLATSVSPMTDHGNQICSIVAATKGNGKCSAGIAYNATIRVRKIFEVVQVYGRHFDLSPSHWTSSPIFTRAIRQDLNDTDVIIMAWAPIDENFDSLDRFMDSAIKTTALEGRHGRGTLMFVPTGPVGNGLANTVYTITVGGMKKDGRIPDTAFADASVITSGLTEGNNLTSSKMVTTTLRNRCASGFKGVSAATAQIAAIAALVLEANQSLSMRDVKHILVKASIHNGLEESRSFKRNGAGHYFHGILGFGLLNASKAVILAETWVPVPKHFTKSLTVFEKSSSHLQIFFNFSYACILKFEKFCLTKVEEIQVRTRLPSISEIYGIEVISPNGTISVLLDPALSNPSLDRDVRRTPTEVLLTSVHFWDETAIGHWKVKIQFKRELKETFDVDRVNLTIHGTGIGTINDVASTTKISGEVHTRDTATEKPQKENSGNVLDCSYPVFVTVMLCCLIMSVIFPSYS